MAHIGVAASLFCTAQVSATTYQHDFTVGWAASPSFGTFSIDVDPSVIPAGGGDVWGLMTPSDFSLTINGHDVDESTARIGLLSFDSAGALTYAVFGNDCDHGCSVGGSSALGWTMAFWTTTPWWYPYTNVNGVLTAYEGAYGEQAHVFEGHVTPPPVVPEPLAIPLALAGLGVVLIGRPRARLSKHNPLARSRDGTEEASWLVTKILSRWAPSLLLPSTSWCSAPPASLARSWSGTWPITLLPSQRPCAGPSPAGPHPGSTI
jgi:hypothetical protein